jgi:hypothetical protein
MKKVTKNQLLVLLTYSRDLLTGYINSTKTAPAESVTQKKNEAVQSSRLELEAIANAISALPDSTDGVSENLVVGPEGYTARITSIAKNLRTLNIDLEKKASIIHKSYMQGREDGQNCLTAGLTMNWFRSSRVNTATEEILSKVDAFEKRHEVVEVKPGYCSSLFCCMFSKKSSLPNDNNSAIGLTLEDTKKPNYSSFGTP